MYFINGFISKTIDLCFVISFRVKHCWLVVAIVFPLGPLRMALCHAFFLERLGLFLCQCAMPFF